MSLKTGRPFWAIATAATVLLMFVSAQGQQRISPRAVKTSAGVTERKTLPMAVITGEMLRNAAKVQGGAQGQPRAMRNHVPPGFEWVKQQAEQRKLEALSRRGATSQAAYAPPPTTGLLGVVFPALNFNETLCGCLPPDTIAAAGPNYIVETVNSAFGIYDKTGNALLIAELSTLFSATGESFFSDPQVLYDQNDNRFIIAGIGSNLDLLIAVSLDSNPLDGFNAWIVPVGGGNTPDFPKMGLSQTAVYISDNLFTNTSVGAELRVIQLSDLLAGNSTLTITQFPNVVTASGYTAWAIEPAHTYGSANNEYLVAAAAPFFTSPTQQLNLFSINTTGTPTLSALDLTVPAWTEPPSADQPGAPGSVATDSSFLLNSVWNNGSLVTAHQIASSDLTKAVAQYFVINLPDNAGIAGATIADSGILGTGDTYYPAITVRADGSVGVVYNESSTTEYISMYGAARLPSDPAGQTSPLLVVAGTTTNGDSFRWGDYSGISIDPTDNSLWLAAEPAGTTNPIWETDIANVNIQGASTTTLTANTYTPMYLQPIILTATVTSQLGGPVSGTVSFFNNGALLGTSTISGNVATWTIPSLPMGKHPEIEAVYNGSSLLGSSLSNDIVLTVKKARTITVEVSSLNPAHFGQTVTFTATVTGLYGGVPTGTVTFFDGTTLLGSQTLVGGKASFSTSALPIGRNPIRAVYGGDAHFTGSGYGLPEIVTQ